MKKKDKHPEEYNEPDKVSEPLADYGTETEMTFSPPLTDEELEDSITGDELLEAVTNHIHELFSKK